MWQSGRGNLKCNRLGLIPHPRRGRGNGVDVNAVGGPGQGIINDNTTLPPRRCRHRRRRWRRKRRASPPGWRQGVSRTYIQKIKNVIFKSFMVT